MRRTWFTNPVRVLMIVGLPLSMGSCASHQSPGGSPASRRAFDPSVAPSINALEGLARRQAANPVAVDLPPPAGLDAALVSPLDPVPIEASLSLEDLLPTLAAHVPVNPVEPPAVAPDAAATEAALRLYARAHAAYYADKPANAIGFLDEAAKADPSRPEIWLLRGDILSNTSQRFGANAAYQRALDLGRISPRACLFLGMSAIERNDHSVAARFLAGAITSHGEGEDPALPILAHAGLGTSLHKLGHVRAGNEALTVATSTGLQFTATTSYRVDLQTLARRRSDLARDVGDGWARLGSTKESLEAYERAASLPSFDPSAITERRVYVLARSGRPAEAALTLLDDIVRAELRIDDRHLSLLKSLATHTDLGPTLSRAVAELPALASRIAKDAGAAEPLITPTIEGRLARAAVAIHPTSARPVLEAYLAQYPHDDAVCREWASLLSTDPLEASATAESMIERQPLAAMNVGRRLSQVPLGREIALAEMDRSGSRESAAGATLLAALRIARGEWSEASHVLRSAPRWTTEAGLAAQALVAASAGDDQFALELLELVRDPTNRARVQLALQTPNEARATLAGVSTAPDRIDSLMLGAEIAVLQREAVDAESMLRRAVALDPFDETLYERLAGLYRPGAPMPDQDKLFGVYRDLREAVPSSRLLRTLNAQDAAQRGQFGLAEQELTSLVQLDPEDVRALQTLSLVWERLARTEPATSDRAIALLASLREQQPGSTVLAIAMARALGSADRAPEARDLLERQLDSCPTPEVATALEAIMTEHLSQSALATEHARRRLSPLPRPIDATIELARACAASGSIAEAASVLEIGLPPRAIVSPSQSALLQIMVAEVGPVAETATDASSVRDTIRLLDLVASRTSALAPGLHELRVSLLAADPEVTPQRLIDAIEQARKDAPALGSRPSRLAMGKLLDSDRNEIALAVAVNDVERSAVPDPDLALAAVRLVVAVGEASQLERTLGKISTMEEASAILSPIHPDGDLALKPGATLDQAKGEIAFIAANAMSISEDRAEMAFDVYRLALRYDPAHAMAANNLGYTLLERNINPDEAASLLELAYRLEPDDPNVIDSIGWLRYQQDRIDDVTASDGSVDEGAVTLLQKALIVDADGGSPVSLDHYADALWASGQREDALEQWQNALATLERLIATLAGSGRSDPEHAVLLAALNAKIEAAKQGREPEIAPRRLATSGGASDGRP